MGEMRLRTSGDGCGGTVTLCSERSIFLQSLPKVVNHVPV